MPRLPPKTDGGAGPGAAAGRSCRGGRAEPPPLATSDYMPEPDRHRRHRAVRLARRRRDLPDRSASALEPDAVPLQPRLRDARQQQPGDGRRRPGHRRLAAHATASRWPGPRTRSPAGRSSRRCRTRSPRWTCSTRMVGRPGTRSPGVTRSAASSPPGLIQQLPASRSAPRCRCAACCPAASRPGTPRSTPRSPSSSLSTRRSAS